MHVFAILGKAAERCKGVQTLMNEATTLVSLMKATAGGAAQTQACLARLVFGCCSGWFLCGVFDFFAPSYFVL